MTPVDIETRGENSMNCRDYLKKKFFFNESLYGEKLLFICCFFCCFFALVGNNMHQVNSQAIILQFRVVIMKACPYQKMPTALNKLIVILWRLIGHMEKQQW